MDKPFTEEELSKVLANPFYCLRSVHPIFVQDHDTLVSEEQWVKASANLIREIGAEKFLRLLLENLKGNYCSDHRSAVTHSCLKLTLAFQ